MVFCWILKRRGTQQLPRMNKNKRERLVAFIEKGKLFAASVLEKLYEMEENAMQRLSHDQRNQLVICSTKYYELLKEEIEHGPYIMN